MQRISLYPWYTMHMNTITHVIQWEAPEHRYTEKTNDWYWVVGIIAISASIASIIFGNVLFGIVILLGAVVVMIYDHKKPRTIFFEISSRGIYIEKELYTYASLESFCIDEVCPHGPQLIVKPYGLFAQLLIISLPEAHIESIEHILMKQLPKEHIEEPLAHRILEYFGF
jgi:hypothetical protein